MTYRKLLNTLINLTDEQLGCDAAIETPDGEIFPLTHVGITEEDDVLDKGHPFLSTRST